MHNMHHSTWNEVEREKGKKKKVEIRLDYWTFFFSLFFLYIFFIIYKCTPAMMFQRVNLTTSFILVSLTRENPPLLYLQAAMNIGSNTSNVANSGQSYQPSITVPSFSHAPSVVPSPVPTLQVPSLPRSASSTPPLPIHETPDPISSSNLATNLVKPSSFFAPPSSSSALIMPPMPSSMPTAGLHPPLNLQRPYGAPMLQPFPPPAPPASLTPTSSPSPNYGPVINRDKVRDALLLLAQVFPSLLLKEISALLIMAWTMFSLSSIDKY